MRKDFDDELDFLDELELDKHTKDKKKSKAKYDAGHRDEGKRTRTAKMTSEKAPRAKKSSAAASKKKRRKKENFLMLFWENICGTAAEMSAGDRIIVSTGVIVLVMAIITGSVYVSAKSMDDQVAAFAELGEDLGAVSLTGESGLIAVTDAEVAAMNSEMLEETEETEETEEETEEEA